MRWVDGAKVEEEKFGCVSELVIDGTSGRWRRLM
jgi:hypothetical protein